MRNEIEKNKDWSIKNYTGLKPANSKIYNFDQIKLGIYSLIALKIEIIGNTPLADTS